jgi:hypothetical protein
VVTEVHRHQPFTVGSQLWFQASPCGICDGQSDTGTGVSSKYISFHKSFSLHQCCILTYSTITSALSSWKLTALISSTVQRSAIIKDYFTLRLQHQSAVGIIYYFRVWKFSADFWVVNCVKLITSICQGNACLCLSVSLINLNLCEVEFCIT